MHEVFPILAGIAIGAGVQRLPDARLRAIVLVVLGVAAGALASLISGELAISLGFIPVDVAQVLIAAAGTAALIAAWQRRPAGIR